MDSFIVKLGPYMGVFQWLVYDSRIESYGIITMGEDIAAVYAKHYKMEIKDYIQVYARDA